MAKASLEDARILLDVMNVYLSEPVGEARRFWRTIPDCLGYEELLAKYQRESKEIMRKAGREVCDAALASYPPNNSLIWPDSWIKN